jgi:3-oxoacyl-[acyl-carrier protein] reductase
MDFSGQHTIVSGATRGIGRAIAEAFLAAGATVIGTYGAAEEDARQFQAAGGWGERLQLHRCDVADHLAVAEFYCWIEERYGAVEILVANAGIRRDALTATMHQEEWQRVIDVNLTGTFNMAKQALLLMLKKKYGRMIFITSPMAHLGFAGQANYAASKAGQIGLMRSLAKETAKRKITVNCVSPGFIDTELLADLNDEQLKEYKKMVPMRRFGQPAEVAAAVLFLASDQAAYITGSVLDVNGGL